MRRPCPKCGLGSDDQAAYCRWCGADLRAVHGVNGPPAGDEPPPGLYPPPPPGSGFPTPPSGAPPTPPAGGHPAPPSSGGWMPPASGIPMPPDSGLPPPPSPGYPPAFEADLRFGPGNMLPFVPTHLVWAILSTILCCNPLGIVSIVYSAQVNAHLIRGDVRRAQRSSRLARNWVIATAAVSLVGWIIYGVAIAVGGLGAWSWLRS